MFFPTGVDAKILFLRSSARHFKMRGFLILCSFLFVLPVAWFLGSSSVVWYGGGRPTLKKVNGGGEQEAFVEDQLLVLRTVLRSLVGEKKVIIKIGVLSQDAHAEDEFWVELDPTMQMKIDQNSWLLPFFAWTETKAQNPFHIHEMPGCSSGYLPAGSPSASSTNHLSALELCYAFSENNDPSTWYLWDSKVDTFEQLARGAGACESCQDPRNVKSHVTFPSLKLSSILRLFDNIELLDVDAQGADFELLLSVESELHRVQNIKCECQLKGFSSLYASKVENHCEDITAFLKQHGFELANKLLNNCGCGEYNLFFRKQVGR